jgi:hypothetical protein
MDSSESPLYGEQEGAAYNGHFGCMCYHPLFCFNQFGDCEEGYCSRAMSTSLSAGGRYWSQLWNDTRREEGGCRLCQAGGIGILYFENNKSIIAMEAILRGSYGRKKA